MEVTPGIYQLALPSPGKLEGVKAYFIHGDGSMLVDTGWDTPESFAALRHQLNEAGFGVEDIGRIVITHFHPDHYGLARRLKELSGAKVWLHKAEKDFIHSRYLRPAELAREMGQWLKANGVPEGELEALERASLGMVKYVSPVMPDQTLSGGERFSAGEFEFQVIFTPGHSPGHVCLYEPSKKVLLCGDHLLAEITPHVGLHIQSSESPLDDYLRSLDLISQLEIELALPGHGPSFGRVKERIEELRRHHRWRKAAILAQMEGEAKTAYQIARELPWALESGGIKYQDLGALDKRLAMTETLAHLESLCREGKVEKISRDGLSLYQRKEGG